MSIFQTSLSSRSLALVAGVLLGLCACQSPAPGYRHEAEGPDERLLDLADAYSAQQESGGGSKPGTRIVDPGRIQNELRQLNLEYPNHVPTLYMLATVAYENGVPERAAAYIDDLNRIQPIHPEAGLLRSRLAINDGNLNAARRVLEQQIRYTPDHAGLREALGSVSFMEGDLESARADLRMASRLGAPSWRVEYNLGLVEEADDNLSLAIEHYQRALEDNAGFLPASSRLAGLRAEMGEEVR